MAILHKMSCKQILFTIKRNWTEPEVTLLLDVADRSSRNLSEDLAGDNAVFELNVHDGISSYLPGKLLYEVQAGPDGAVGRVEAAYLSLDFESGRTPVHRLHVHVDGPTPYTFVLKSLFP